MNTTQGPPTPALFFETITAYQKSAALKAALELGVFTVIDAGAHSAADIARQCAASERGTRMLCDFLAVNGLLTKTADGYALTPDSAMFLSKRSPAYAGGAAGFLLSPAIVGNFDRLAETVRQGTVAPEGNTVAEENPVWIAFARSMAPLTVPAAQAITGMLDLPSSGGREIRVLDIAAGHGMFGITIAQRVPNAIVVAVDWPDVLEVAKENAGRAGIEARYQTRPGDAFKVEFGGDYEAALVTNFLHHFDVPTCTAFLKKVGAALRPGGRVAILEFVPNDDRISPPIPASFVMNMLAGTPSGDVYTLKDLTGMLDAAGFTRIGSQQLPSFQTIVVGMAQGSGLRA
jgi:2-polyprenyl-3-methyl-5-hydroxy-6-metoxy-1,4-benzoquinol methylase